MGFLASTPFIGPAGNNFSHKIKNRIQAYLSQAESSCPTSVQSLSQSDSAFVPLRFTTLSRFATEAGQLQCTYKLSAFTLRKFPIQLLKKCWVPHPFRSTIAERVGEHRPQSRL
jgi:hypothetical protein